MPFYRFRVDLPEQTPVVAERLRPVIGSRADRWIEGISARLFYGRMENNEFRIQRNIGRYRNSFLPRIFGRLTPAGAGTTLNVTMWMNPAVFLFIAFWTGSLAAISIALFASHQRGAILLPMMFLGAGSSLGLFYWEALRARSLLIKTATASDVPLLRPQLLPSENAPPVRNNVLRALVWAIVAVSVVPMANLLFTQRQQFKTSPVVKQTLALASNSDAVKKILGDNIKADGSPHGALQDRKDFGFAAISLPLRGSRSKGTVHVFANRVGSEWRLERVALWTNGDTKRIDLSPPIVREKFSYPAPGVIYLMPFDKESASQMAEMPAYFAARLGVQVIILPARSLPASTIDAEREQVTAERAIDFIEREARRGNAGLDDVFLGVTAKDLYIRSSGWNYATAFRREHFGIVSTWRFRNPPPIAHDNREIVPERLRKILTKNLALLHYPISSSADLTSVVASWVNGGLEADRMTEEFLGQLGKWTPAAESAPCFSVMQGPGGRQAWSPEWTRIPPNDNRFETFDNCSITTSLVIARTDFPYYVDSRLSLIRKQWSKDDRSRSFGLGGNDSFDIFPVGDSDTFSWMDLIHEDGSRTSFRRTSFGTGIPNAQFRAAGEVSDPFANSTIKWNGNGWDLNTFNNWIFTFPSSGPKRSGQQSALIAITSPISHVTIHRNDAGVPTRIDGLSGATIVFQSDKQNRIIEARHSSGHSISYKYTPEGRLSAISDSQTGVERYEYDSAGRLTRVLDAKGTPELSIAYGYSGEIAQETLADGRTLRFEYKFYPSRELMSVILIDDRGYKTEWKSGENGFYRNLPEALP